MADYDPAHQSGGDWDDNDNGGSEVTDGDEQEDIQELSTDQDQAEYSVDADQDASGDSPSPDGPPDDAGDYDPASVTAAPDAAAALQPAAADNVPLRPSPQRAAKQKPRSAGGFLVGDSDSEDDDQAPVPASSGPAVGVVSQTPVQRSPPQPAAIVKTSPVAASTEDLAPQVNVAAATTELAAGRLESGGAAALSASAAPQIPIDRISQLEGRVREDSRGAMDSWLALIAEYRSKGDILQSRQIYDRFLAVFPQAVRPSPPLSISMEQENELTSATSRLMCGSSISPWSWT